MLFKELNEIRSQILEQQSKKVRLSRQQLRLLNQLNFIDKNLVIEKEMNKYTYEETLNESFAVASSVCPACGKKI